MILEHIIQCTPNSHCTCRWIVGLGTSHRPAGVLAHFIDSTYVKGLAPIGLDLLDQIAIGVIGKRRDLSAYGHGGKPVFGIECIHKNSAGCFAKTHAESSS